MTLPAVVKRDSDETGEPAKKKEKHDLQWLDDIVCTGDEPATLSKNEIVANEVDKYLDEAQISVDPLVWWKEKLLF